MRHQPKVVVGRIIYKTDQALFAQTVDDKKPDCLGKGNRAFEPR